MERTASSALLIDPPLSRPSFLRQILSFFDNDDEVISDDTRPVSFLQLFRFASRMDGLIILLASFFSLIAGFITPIHMFVVGRITTLYVDEKTPVDNDTFLWSVWRWSVLYGIGFLVALVVEYVQHYLHMLAAERMMQRCRRKFVEAVLRKKYADLDLSTGELSNRLNSCISTFIVSTSISLALDWQTTLLMLGADPIYVLSSTLLPRLTEKSTKRSLAVSEEANGVAEESIVNVKTVASCNGQKQMIEKYSSILESGIKPAVRIASSSSLLEALSNLIYNAFNCSGLWFATVSYHNGRVTSAGNVFSVVYLSLIAANRFSRLGPQLITVLKARIAAAKVYEIIDSIPEDFEAPVHKIDPSRGELVIEFTNVSFSYPSRGAPALSHLNIHLPPGQTSALVGKSGCGKSTTLKLLTRLIDCDQGSISVDGVDLKECDTVKWRKMIGVVSQEPCLFNGTIRENICLGRPFTQNQMVSACKTAFAHEFIVALDRGYETVLGPSGVALSGGQKQRIAIARAIISNPRLLLLDEATSALDSKSERIVQGALESASEGRSTIIVAHRLSTIKNVHQVIVMENGEVVESGGYDELRSRNDGIFARMIQDQEVESVEDSNERENSTVEVDVDDPERVLIPNEIEEQTFPTIKGGFLALLARNKWKTLVVILMGVLRGIANPLLSARYFFVIGSLEEEKYETLLFWLVVGTMSVGLYHFFLQLISQPICQYIGESIMNELRVSSLRSLLHRPQSYFDSSSTSPSGCALLLSQQPPIAMAMVDHKLAVVVDGLFSCVTILVLTFLICFPNGFVGVLYLLTYLALLILLEKHYDRANKALVEADTSGELAVEIFENLATIQQLGVEMHFQRKYDQIQEGRATPLSAKVGWQSLVHATNESIFMLFDCIATSVGVYFVFTGDYSTKQLFTTECLVSNVGFLTCLMSYSLKEMLAASSAVKLLFGLIDPEDGVKKDEYNNKIKLGSISADSLSFSYPSRPSRTVLADVSFKVENARSLAIVGPSGGGKSTVVNLLQRFYDPNRGELTLDNNPFRSLSYHNLRSNIALVSQEPILFSGTITENVLLGVENGSEEDVREACRMANAHEFIQDFPQGYETLVGEKGRSLSGGQKQRIAIARALVRNPKVIILDEATSALDTQSEKAVRAALECSSQGRTAISIAHRLDTIRHCDEIVFVEEGRILERGSHEELITKRGKYWRMVDEQRLSSDASHSPS